MTSERRAELLRAMDGHEDAQAVLFIVGWSPSEITCGELRELLTAHHVELRITTRCPSCGHQSLFIGKGGHLTCSWLECKEPGLERAIEKLTAQPAPSGWQPIETAPKDGTAVIGFDPGRESEWMLGIEFMRWLDGMWRDPATHRCRPTHWMPLTPTPGKVGE